MRCGDVWCVVCYMFVDQRAYRIDEMEGKWERGRARGKGEREGKREGKGDRAGEEVEREDGGCKTCRHVICRCACVSGVENRMKKV